MPPLHCSHALRLLTGEAVYAALALQVRLVSPDGEAVYAALALQAHLVYAALALQARLASLDGGRCLCRPCTAGTPCVS